MANTFNLNPELIVTSVNSYNGTSILPEEVSIEISPDQDTSWLAEGGLGNTVVRIDALPTGRYTGEVLVAYDRLDIKNIYDMVGGFIGIPDTVLTVHAALPYFEDRYGIILYADDFEDLAITWTEGVGAEVILRPLAESLVWIGEQTFTSTYLPDTLGSLITTKELQHYDVLREVGDKYFAEGLVYGVDFSEIEQTLTPITADNYSAFDMVNILTPLTSVTWTSEDETGSSEIDQVGSLYNSTLTYNGVNSGYDITNDNYKYVMIIELRDDSEVVTGSLIMHYNDVADTE